MKPDLYTFQELEHLVKEFEMLVKSKSSHLIQNGSKFEAACLMLMEMLGTFKKEIPHDCKKDFREEWRRAIGVGEILRKIINLQYDKKFSELWPHILMLLGDGEVAQNLFTQKEDQTPNKIFELYVALVLMPMSSLIELDDPIVSSNGKNPDVIARIGSEDWSFACKAMHTLNPKTFVERVREGVGQIEVSKAQKGLVVVSFKNIVPHNELWRAVTEPETGNQIYFSPNNIASSIDRLKIECEKYHVKILKLLGVAGFENLFNGKKAVPAIMLHLSTVVGGDFQGKHSFVLLRLFSSIQTKPLHPNEELVLRMMNEMLHESYMDPEILIERIRNW